MASNVEIREARKTDLESMLTILPRSFHPVNPYVKEGLPDTPKMREWWREVYSSEIDDTACHPLVAVDTTTNEVVGVCCLRQIDANGPYGDFWSLFPWTEDHSPTKWRPVIDCLAYHEEKLMRGKTYYQLELMAVDHAYKGRKLGATLLEKACLIADKAGCPIFLQSGSARDFYIKTAGFEIWAEPDWDGYRPYLMGRQPRKVDV